MSEIMIRKLDANAQGAQIYDVLQDAYRAEAARLEVAHFPPLCRTAQDIKAAGTAFLGAHSGTMLVGVLEYEMGRTKQLELCSLGVRTEATRRGIARLLMERAEGCEVIVETERRNMPALALYEALGFERTHERSTGDGFCLVGLRLHG